MKGKIFDREFEWNNGGLLTGAIAGLIIAIIVMFPAWHMLKMSEQAAICAVAILAVAGHTSDANVRQAISEGLVLIGEAALITFIFMAPLINR